MTQVTEAYEWRGRTVVGRDGEKIGTLDEVYLDQQTGKPEWALVNTGLFGTQSNFVPLAGARPAGGDVRVAFSKEQVKRRRSSRRASCRSRKRQRFTAITGSSTPSSAPARVCPRAAAEAAPPRTMR
jgi:sporulation protein YlmC with PRC-barrel domain